MGEKLATLCYKIIKFISCFLPLKKSILFESNPDFADNTLPVYQEMIRRGLNKKYKMIWILNGNYIPETLPKNVSTRKKAKGSIAEKFLAQWEIVRARYIIDSNNFINKARPEQVRIHLKHGLPIKDASYYNKTIGTIDVLCVPSDYWIDICSKEHDIPQNLIKPLGFPRNDILVPQPHKNKTVIWMPTFREHSNKDVTLDYSSVMPLGLPTISGAEQLKEINELFKKNDAYLLIRLHPAQDTSGINLTGMSNVKICDNEFLNTHNTTLYNLLTYTDALISDYSSIYYDYLHLEKPIALVTSDFDYYKKHNGIIAKDYEEFKALFPAVFIEDYSDLISFFENVFEDSAITYKCAEAKKKYISSHSQRSAEKIVDYLIENYNL